MFNGQGDETSSPSDGKRLQVFSRIPGPVIIFAYHYGSILEQPFYEGFWTTYPVNYSLVSFNCLARLGPGFSGLVEPTKFAETLHADWIPNAPHFGVECVSKVPRSSLR